MKTPVAGLHWCSGISSCESDSASLQPMYVPPSAPLASFPQASPLLGSGRRLLLSPVWFIRPVLTSVNTWQRSLPIWEAFVVAYIFLFFFPVTPTWLVFVYRLLVLIYFHTPPPPETISTGRLKTGVVMLRVPKLCYVKQCGACGSAS